MAWTPSTHVEALAADEERPGSLLVEHFDDPYALLLDDTSEATLHAAAHHYLLELAKHTGAAAQLPEHWLASLAPAALATFDEPPQFGWLPFERPGTERAFTGPRGCFRFRSPSHDLVVLFAAERLAPDHYTGSGFGLGLAVHLRAEGSRWQASFTGMTAVLPFWHYRKHPASAPRLKVFAGVFTPASLYEEDAIDTMAALTGLAGLVVLGVRIAVSEQGWWIERRATGMMAATTGAPLPYAVRMLSEGGEAVATRHTITHLAPLVAHAHAQVFEDDPCSLHGRPLRPTRDERPDPPRQPIGLDVFRRSTRIFGPGVARGPLDYPAAPARPVVQVMRCPRFVAGDRTVSRDERRHVGLKDGKAPTLRSDDASAIQAFVHARDLVRRMEAYGWTDAADYFRVTAPQVRIFYRSGISPGPGKDGRTVNARVLPEGWTRAGRPPGGATSPAIQVHLGWADLRRRARQRWRPGGPPAPAVPLGIAADRRWMWHEFGHVLLVASTGELELPFAHGPGDALAAIVADPDSKLSDPLRGMTFPFVFLPRRHDRRPEQGWSWTGTLHQGLENTPEHGHPRSKGYTSEQILSSSLFRLYRCIGGDTRRADAASLLDAHARRRASHYCVYLLMQALQLMGDTRIQATATPAKFVHWLRQADLQHGEWTAAFPPIVFRRVGGTLGKVIRWAFEAQGLYGQGNGPGQPPPVDIYIPDRRPERDEAMHGETAHGAGSYVPVSLHWPSRAATAAGDTPLWQADPDHGILWHAGDALVEVRVGNRGEADADDVGVTLWSAPWPEGTLPPPWRPQGAGWTACETADAPLRTIPAGPPAPGRAFTFRFDPAPGIHLLFAQATCPRDRANTDAQLSLACSRHDTPLADLVASDNNLGLRVLVVGVRR